MLHHRLDLWAGDTEGDFKELLNQLLSSALDHFAEENREWAGSGVGGAEKSEVIW